VATVAIVNQHTNNYGDDAAGVALVREVLGTLEADRVDVFYVWQKSGASGLPIDDDRCTHHFLGDLSGLTDMRVRLALGVLAGRVWRRLARPDVRELVDTCKSADIVFVSPAGSNIGIYKDWTYLFVLFALVLDGVRPIFCQNTVGKSNSWIFNRAALFVLRRSRLFVREEASQKWLASKSLSSYLGVDTALLLDETGLSSSQSAERGYVALVPTRLSTWHRDFKSFDDRRFIFDTLPKAAAAIAGTRGLDVVLVPHLYGAEDEHALLHELASALERLGCDVLIASVATFEDYRNALAGAQVVVSMRYHGLVLAAQSGVPCVSLAYENKMLEAASYLGVSELAIQVSSASEAELRQRVGVALDRLEYFKEKMAERHDQVREVAMGPLLEARSQLLRTRAP
jgi:polysaccharide pyruvyl transferase WcaK-like protein